MPTYYLHKETERRLPDGSKYWEVVKYRDLYHEKYFLDKKWIPRKYGEVDYCNDQRRSVIQNNLPPDYSGIFLKGELYDILKGREYIPDFYRFNLKAENWESKLAEFLENCEKGLWFIKKTFILTYGGYDVFPFHISDPDKALGFILDKIQISNSYEKYRSDDFVIQRGIEKIYLTPDFRKFDLRTYGLVVWEDDVFNFYYFKFMLMRKSIMKYNPESDELSVQLTNTTQTRLEKTDLHDLTELVDESYPWYEDIYSKTMESFSHVCKYIKGVKAKSLPTKGYHLIGLDFLPSEDGIVYLLEINKHPAIYYDEERMTRLHHRMESRLFTHSFFDTVLLPKKTTLTPDNFNKINI